MRISGGSTRSAPRSTLRLVRRRSPPTADYLRWIVYVEGLFQAAFLLALAGEFSESRALLDWLPARDRRYTTGHGRAHHRLRGVGNGSAASATVAKMTASPILNASDVLAVAPAFEAHC